MSLRSRLWLVLGGLVLVPLAVGALVLLLAVPDARMNRVSADVDRFSSAVRTDIIDECRTLGLAVQVLGYRGVLDSPQAAAKALVAQDSLDFAAVLDDTGRVLASAGELPAAAGAPADLPTCTSDSGSTTALLSERVPFPDGANGSRTAIGVRLLDVRLLREIRASNTSSGGEIVLLDGDRVVLSTVDEATTAALAGAASKGPGKVRVEGWSARVAEPTAGLPWTTVVGAPDPTSRSRTLPFALILLAAALVAGALVMVVARSLSKPFAEITEAAEALARGELDTAITSTDDSEAGRLGSAFNQMTDELRRSREDLRGSLERIGDTLSSTHDRNGLLQVMLDTAMVTLHGNAGVVLELTDGRLTTVAEHSLLTSELPVPTELTPGRGVLGGVVSTGEAVRGRLGSGPDELAPTVGEPDRGEVLAVPVRSMGTVIGVIALYGRADGQPFTREHEQALETLTGQASIAVDNVHLHHEAQRLSTTDPLTGLWNFRYLSTSLAREIERSTRFERPLAVLMLDLDHFKAVNDSYGHARGDSVLRELALRVQEQIREVDTFARYGGEEFVVVLPETTVEGASQLAERICVAVSREPFRQEGEPPLLVTLSLGVAAFPDHGNTAATLMRAADQALYAAKAAGRDRWLVAGQQG